jgi:hypothetical protein
LIAARLTWAKRQLDPLPGVATNPEGDVMRKLVLKTGMWYWKPGRQWTIIISPTGTRANVLNHEIVGGPVEYQSGQECLDGFVVLPRHVRAYIERTLEVNDECKNH